MTELDSPDNLMFQMTILRQKNTLIKKEDSRLGGVELGTKGGNEDRRGQEGDVFASQNTPRRLYKGAPGVRAADYSKLWLSSDLSEPYLGR